MRSRDLGTKWRVLRTRFRIWECWVQGLAESTLACLPTITRITRDCWQTAYTSQNLTVVCVALQVRGCHGTRFQTRPGEPWIGEQSGVLIAIPRGSYPTPFLGYLVLWLGSAISKSSRPTTGVGYEPLGTARVKVWGLPGFQAQAG